MNDLPDWMTESVAPTPAEMVASTVTEHHKGLYDLPIFRTFWEADARDIGR